MWSEHLFEKLRLVSDYLRGKRFLRLIGVPTHRNQSGDFFITQVLRTKSAEDLLPVSFDDAEDSWAIVVQGPIETRDDYTLTTVSRYREWYPSAPIFVSTWNDQDPKILDDIRDIGCEVIVLDRAGYEPGPANQNLQMATTRAAMLQVKAVGSRFVVKTRCDQRINNRFAIPSLPELLRTFPFEGTGDQKHRLVVPSLNTFVFRPYSVTDMLMFGGVDEMLCYWDGAFDIRTNVVPRSTSLRDWSKMRVAEAALCANFLERTGLTLDFSLQQYWRALAERFVVLDQSFFDLHWPKYSRVENRWGIWQDKPKFREVNFSLWVLMHSGVLSSDDSLLDEEN